MGDVKEALAQGHSSCHYEIFRTPLESCAEGEWQTLIGSDWADTPAGGWGGGDASFTHRNSYATEAVSHATVHCLGQASAGMDTGVFSSGGDATPGKNSPTHLRLHSPHPALLTVL